MQLHSYRFFRRCFRLCHFCSFPEVLYVLTSLQTQNALLACVDHHTQSLADVANDGVCFVYVMKIGQVPLHFVWHVLEFDVFDALSPAVNMLGWIRELSQSKNYHQTKAEMVKWLAPNLFSLPVSPLTKCHCKKQNGSEEKSIFRY